MPRVVLGISKAWKKVEKHQIDQTRAFDAVNHIYPTTTKDGFQTSYVASSTPGLIK